MNRPRIQKKGKTQMNTRNPGEPVEGAIAEPDFVNETPEDIENFLADHGIKDVTYNCTVKRFPKEGGEIASWLPINMKNNYPSIDEVGKRFGPGKYLFCFSWRETNEDGKRITRMKEHKIVLDDEWNDIYDEYMAEKWAQKNRKIENERNRAKMKAAAKGIDLDEVTGEPRDPLEDLKNSLSVLKELGVPFGGNGKALSAEGDLGMMQLMMSTQAENTKLLVAMMAQSANNANNMIMALLKNNQPQTNTDMFKEIMQMVTGTIQLKEALNPEKKGVVDKVFELMEQVMPQILQMSQQRQSERVQNPLYKIAAESNEMDLLRKDPAALAYAIEKWDKAHGPEQTNMILKTVGLTRPEGVQFEQEGAVHEPSTSDHSTDYEEIDDESTINPLTGEPAEPLPETAKSERAGEI